MAPSRQRHRRMAEHTPISPVSRVEMISTGARRRWTLAGKRRIVAESYTGHRSRRKCGVRTFHYGRHRSSTTLVGSLQASSRGFLARGSSSSALSASLSQSAAFSSHRRLRSSVLLKSASLRQASARRRNSAGSGIRGAAYAAAIRQAISFDNTHPTDTAVFTARPL